MRRFSFWPRPYWYRRWHSTRCACPPPWPRGGLGQAGCARFAPGAGQCSERWRCGCARRRTAGPAGARRRGQPASAAAGGAVRGHGPDARLRYAAGAARSSRGRRLWSARPRRADPERGRATTRTRRPSRTGAVPEGRRRSSRRRSGRGRPECRAGRRESARHRRQRAPLRSWSPQPPLRRAGCRSC